MKIVDDIIELLTSDNPDLNNALFKTKVLMHQIGEKSLIEWVNHELNGYPPDTELPDYRILDITVLGSINNGFQRYPELPLPTLHLDEKLRKQLDKSHLRQSIAVIEKYAENESDLTVSIAPEYFPILSKKLDSGFFVERAWGKHSSGAMLQVTIEVRSRLLDFLLELSDRIGPGAELKDVSQATKKIGVNELFQNAIFKGNTTILVGDGGVQNITSNVSMNDFESLAQELRNLSVPDSDVDELKEAIESDEGSSEHASQNFGNSVRLWFSKMIGKASDLSWNVSIATASTLLSDAISRYYGWK